MNIKKMFYFFVTCMEIFQLTHIKTIILCFNDNDLIKSFQIITEIIFTTPTVSQLMCCNTNVQL